jgi:hypothetical protein
MAKKAKKAKKVKKAKKSAKKSSHGYARKARHPGDKPPKR